MANVIDINDVILESGMASEMTDYTEMAMASLLETLQEYKKLEMFELIRESEWVQECLESGFVLPIMIPLFEADGEEATVDVNADGDNKTLAAREFNLRDMSNAIKLWMDKLITKINQMVIKRARKYVPWVKDIRPLLKSAATRVPAGNSIKMTPYYDGKWKADVGVCTNAFGRITRSIQAKDYNDFSFASPIVNPDEVAARSSNLSNYIKNYFRYGLKNTTEISTEVLTGEDLGSKYIEMMADYIIEYEKNVISNVNKISKAYNPNKVQAAVNNAEKSAEPAGESFYYDADTRLSIEDRLISESMLSTLINYRQVMEWSPGTKSDSRIDQSKANANAAAQAEKEKQDRQKAGIEVDGDKDANVKDVEVVGKDGKEIDQNQEKTEKRTKGTSTALTNYMRSVEYFVKLVISGYATACDERFITYLNVIKVVGNYGEIPKPKFDAKGNYESGGVIKQTATKAATKVSNAGKQAAAKAGNAVRKGLKGNK